MTEGNERSVYGFLFMTDDDAKMAKSELSKIEKIEEKIDYSNIEKVKLVYEKTIQSKIFKTQVGIDYLRKLQNYLHVHGTGEDDICDIPIAQIYQVREKTSPAVKQVKPAEKIRKKTEEQSQKEKKNMSIFINVVLALLIVLMFYMTTKSPNPNILNYERALQDKYASWEEELSQREQVIREKEKELLIGEQK